MNILVISCSNINTFNIYFVSELVSVATPVQVPDSEMPQEPSDPTPEPMYCEIGTQVIPDKRNARVQTTQRTKTFGIHQSS